MSGVKQQKIDEDVFLKMRKEVLSGWPTGAEVDFDEAVEYQKKLPENRNFGKILAKYHAEGKLGLYPRSGVPTVEGEIELLRSMNEVGVRLFPFTTDSYTRNMQLEKAQQGLDESIKTGKAKLNGFPIICHGVKQTRKVVESCEGGFDVRSSMKANSFVAEIAFASGMTCMPNSPFGWIGSYDKLASVEECLSTAQYLGRLAGYYADRGVYISITNHGWLFNGIVPMYINTATKIIEALLTAGQGAKSSIPLMNFQGNINQDVADFYAVRNLLRKYLDKFGFTDVVIPGVIGDQSMLYPFPQDIGSAFGYINYIATIAAMAPIDGCSVKTVDEASGVPSIESHMQTYRSAGWIFDVVRQQKIQLMNDDIKLEQHMSELAVSAIIDKVAEMGDGDVVVGIEKAINAGVLDSPFCLNVNAKDQVLGVKDLQGASRYLDYGNLPIPKEVREFNDEKIRERELVQGRKLGFRTSLADFWAFSQGSIIGEADEDAQGGTKLPEMDNPPTIITGTVGVDSHVIGTKIISRALREAGFRVVALSAQTPPEEFIKAAQETNADAMLISSLYGMAEMDLQGFRDKCTEAGVGGILLFLGGILGVGKHDFADDEVKFKKIGFDRVYPPESDVELSIRDLCADLKSRGRL
ncbi:MAG: methylaspartate mutase subunit S [Oscillospiraceae bacterium]|nr:methylaspartate mutase subunit S [Oscillospiraceae bacterium]